MVVPPNKGSHHHPGRTIATVAEPPYHHQGGPKLRGEALQGS